MYLHARTVICQLVTLHDGMAYNSTEIVWNAEPKDVVYMSPYVLAFTADTVEIRMASNGSLIQTIAVPDLHLLSKKVKKINLIFIHVVFNLLHSLSHSHTLTLSLPHPFSLSVSLSPSLPLSLPLSPHRVISISPLLPT